MISVLPAQGLLSILVLLSLYPVNIIAQGSDVNIQHLKEQLDKGIPRKESFTVDSILLKSDLSLPDELRIKAFKANVLIELFF